MEVNEQVFGDGRTFVCTQSDEALADGLSWYRGQNRLLMALRRRYGKEFVYSWVEHRPKAGMRYVDHKGVSRVSEGHSNRHLVVYGTGFLEARWLGDEYARAFNSRITGLELVRSKDALACYMANYLAKGGDEFHKAVFSHNWLFEGWWEFTQYFKYHYGEYPDSDYLYRIRMLGRGIIRQQLAELREIGFFTRFEDGKE